MTQKTHHIIFDLDGTLIDSKYEIEKNYRIVFAEITPESPIDPANLNFGASITDILRDVYGGDAIKIAAAKKSFAQRYDDSDYSETPLYHKVVETLTFLKDGKHRLYIATNKRIVPTLRIIRKKNIAHLFDDIMANEVDPGVTISKRQMVAALKQRHSFFEGFMIGDSAQDIQAGKEEGLKTIAVSYGYENKDIFAAQNPTFTAHSFEEIIPIIQNS